MILRYCRGKCHRTYTNMANDYFHNIIANFAVNVKTTIVLL